MSVDSVMLSNHLILCCPLLLLPSIFPSIREWWVPDSNSNESALLIKWPKYWSFSFNISPSIEYSGLISFRIDSFDFLSVQGTLKSLLQHHCLKGSILWCSAFFMVQLSHLHMTTGKTVALTRQTEKWCLCFCHSLYSKEQVSFNFMTAVTICSDFAAQEFQTRP